MHCRSGDETWRKKVKNYPYGLVMHHLFNLISSTGTIIKIDRRKSSYCFVGRNWMWKVNTYASLVRSYTRITSISTFKISNQGNHWHHATSKSSSNQSGPPCCRRTRNTTPQ